MSDDHEHIDRIMRKLPEKAPRAHRPLPPKPPAKAKRPSKLTPSRTLESVLSEIRHRIKELEPVYLEAEDLTAALNAIKAVKERGSK